VSNIWLLIARPRDPATGTEVTIRLAGGGAQGYTQFGSTAWRAGLVKPPAIVQRLGFDDGRFGDGAVVQAFELRWGGTPARMAELSGLYWRDASFTLYSGPDGGADGDMAVIIAGRIADTTSEPGQLILQMADPAVDLAKPLLGDKTFAGTGGIEGPPEVKGRPKRRAWGKCFNIELWSLDPANNIWVATDPARPLQAIDQVYDRGNAASSLLQVAWAGTIAATLAALIAAVAPPGGAAIAPSISCIKWWFANPGKLSCDVRGEVGAAYVDRPADIAAAMVAAIGGPAIDGASLDEARVARDVETGWLVSNASATVSAELTSLLSGVSLWWSLSAAGALHFGAWAWGPPVTSIKGARADRIRSYAPVSKITLGWKINNLVMSRGDIAAVVLDAAYADGTPIEALKPLTTEGPVLPTGAKVGDRHILTFEGMRREYRYVESGLTAAGEEITIGGDSIRFFEWIQVGDHTADETAANQIVVKPIADRIIRCDAAGAPLAGQLPDIVSIAVLIGGVSIKMDDRVRYNVDSETNVLSTINATDGSPTKGDLTVTGITAGEGFVNVTVTVDGRQLPLIRVRYLKQIGTATSTGGTGAKSATTVPNATVAGASYVIIAPVATVTVATGDRLIASAGLDYVIDGADGDSRVATVKHSYKELPLGPETDFAAGIQGSFATSGYTDDSYENYRGEWVDPVQGHVAANPAAISGLVAGNYEVRTYAKLNATGRTASFFNNILIEAKP
jgi:hypothetical protein